MSFERLGTALLFLSIAVAACFSPAQNDTWWHLRAGEDIWTHHAVDLRDHYSHTADGAYWPNHEWLSQTLIFAGYRLGGLPLLTALVAALVVGAWWVVWQLTPGAGVLRLALFAFATIPSSIAWSLRPQVLTLFMIALTGLVLVRRWHLLLPPLFLIWANLHAGVMLGFAVLGGALLAAAVDERRWPVRLGVIVGCCVAATMLTPLGPSLWTEVPATLARTRPYGIMEWQAPGLLEPLFAPFWFLAAALVTSILAVRPWREPQTHAGTMIGAALAMLPLALSSGRNVPPFMLLAVPAIAVLWSSRAPADRRTPTRREHPLLNTAILGFFGVVGVATVGYTWISQSPRLGWHPLPPQAITALEACPEPLYNRYDEGGYLIWFLPKRKVFLDSRQDPYPSTLVQAQIQAEASGNYEELFDQYAIRCAFVATDTPIARRLAADGWNETYKGPAWSVLTRDAFRRVTHKDD
ncbi:MAG TPA: hypothetical protein VM818_14050 [Vicinamibacterales bacterium]|jgi:hypothetical protein|nr:hypothetical protein [Vicinamibacterales bacterium]